MSMGRRDGNNETAFCKLFECLDVCEFAAPQASQVGEEDAQEVARRELAAVREGRDRVENGPEAPLSFPANSNP